MTDLTNMSIDSNPDAILQDVLKPMPRRKQLPTAMQQDDYRLYVRKVRKPEISVLQVFQRMIVWAVAASRLLFRFSKIRFKGRVDAADMGILLRLFFQEVGGTAIKIGQQLASRVDMLDFKICSELTLLTDRVPPFEFDQAKEIIETSIGKPMLDVFESIDTEPVGSASIACVFRGILLTGEDVAIKVQRPGIAEQFASDVACLELLTRSMEMLTLVRPGFFKHLRTEMENLFYQELDFIQEARFQSLYRRDCKRAGIKWLTAPYVYHHLSSLNLLVSEYVEGLICADLVKAVETDDQLMLELYAHHDINPKVIAKRVLYQANWRRYEEAFFHADPHPANIIILPGNEIVMIDFGSCGLTTAQNRRNDLAYVHYALKNDISAFVEIAVNNAMPLPRIDVEEFRSYLERYLWQNRLAQVSKEAEWWERSSAGVFLGLARANRELNIPLVPNMLEVMRATLLYDTLALRLHPKLDLHTFFRRYIKKSNQRSSNRFKRRMKKERHRDRVNRKYAEAARVIDTLQWGEYWLDSVTDKIPVNFQFLSGKGAYVFNILFRWLMTTGTILAGTIGLLWLLASTGNLNIPQTELPGLILTHPIFLIVFGFLSLQALRRIAFRLGDSDPNK